MHGRFPPRAWLVTSEAAGAHNNLALEPAVIGQRRIVPERDGEDGDGGERDGDEHISLRGHSSGTVAADRMTDRI